MTRCVEHTRRTYLRSIGAATAVGLAGCLGTDESGPIPMGSVLPVTRLGSIGPAMQEAVDIAVSDVNKAGGPLDRIIDVTHRDSERRPERGVEAYNALVEEADIIGFVGAASSKVSKPIARHVSDDEVMQMSHLSASPVLTQRGYADGIKYFGRTVAPSNSQAKYYTPEGMSDPARWDEHELTIDGFYPSARAPESEGLSRFKKKIETPYPFTPHAYDALFLMALAVHSAGEASGTAIARTIRSVSRPPGTAVTVDEFDVATSLIDDGEEINYEGASGAVDLNEALEPNAPPYREPAESDG